MVKKLSREEEILIERLEEELWCEETRFNLERMEEIIAQDFFEFGRSGRIYKRSDTLCIPPQPIKAVIPLLDFKARALAKNVVQVTYTSIVTYDNVIEKARRSSIWTKSPQGWILRFHQGTPF